MKTTDTLEEKFLVGIKENKASWNESMESLYSQVHPEFLSSLENFHKKVLKLTEDISLKQKKDILDEEYDFLVKEFKEVENKNNIKRNSDIISL